MNGNGNGIPAGDASFDHHHSQQQQQQQQQHHLPRHPHNPYSMERSYSTSSSTSGHGGPYPGPPPPATNGNGAGGGWAQGGGGYTHHQQHPGYHHPPPPTSSAALLAGAGGGGGNGVPYGYDHHPPPPSAPAPAPAWAGAAAGDYALSLVLIVQSAPLKLRPRNRLMILNEAQGPDPALWRKDASSPTPGAMAATSWGPSGNQLVPNGIVAIYAPVDDVLVEYRFFSGDEINLEATNMTSLPTTTSTITGTSITIPDAAPISASNSFEVGGSSICVFVGLDDRSGNRSPGLYLYEDVASNTIYGDANGWNLKNIQPLQQGLHSVASAAWSTVTFSVVYQTADRQVYLMERAGGIGNSWTTPIVIATPDAGHEMSLIINSDSERYLWMDNGDRWAWTGSSWSPYAHPPISSTASSAHAGKHCDVIDFICKMNQEYDQGQNNVNAALDNLNFAVHHLKQGWHLTSGVAARLHAWGQSAKAGANGMGFSAVNVPGGQGSRFYATDGTGKLVEGALANGRFAMGLISPEKVVAADLSAPMVATAHRLSMGSFI
ncbi:hypothetical protein FRB98_008133, partial [Tulasnella sp. 332]